MDLTLPLKKIMHLSHKKMANRSIKHLENALFFKSPSRLIYFWPYSIKGRYIDYQKPNVDLTLGPRPWGQPWLMVSYIF